MIGFFSQSPDCNDEQVIQQIYSSYENPYGVCMLDRAKIRACRYYFATACINFAFIITTTALFILLARGAKEAAMTLPAPEPPNQQRLFRQWQRTSLQRRSIFGTVLGAIGHFVFSTAVLISQSYYGTGTCQIFLWGVILGFYTWNFALCWRAYRLYFLLKLNMLKTRYASIHGNIEHEQRVIEDRDYQWLIQHKDCHSIMIMRPLVLYLSLFFILVIVCILAEWRKVNCDLTWGVYMLLGFLAFFLTIVAPCVLWRSHRFKDAHGIRNEILIDMAAGIVCFIMTLIWYFFVTGTPVRSPGGNYYNKFFAPRNWLMFFTTVGYITSVVYPIWQLIPENYFKFHHAGDEHSSHHNSLVGQGSIQSTHGGRPILTQTPETLEQLLRDPEAVNQLTQLAVRDFSSENVLAYKEYLKLVDRLQYQKYGRVVKRFSRRYYSSTSTLVDFQPLDNIDPTSNEKDDNLLATSIRAPLLEDFAKYYDTYIREGAPLQVNISYRARNELDSFFTRARSTHQIDTNDDDVDDNTTLTARNLIAPWSHNKPLSPLLPVHIPPNNNNTIQLTRWSWSVETEFPPHESTTTTATTTTSNTSINISEPQLTLCMFEPARNELFWNIFASVFPKYINNQ
ncbi:hypothetical protein BDA99DRAFT_588872 [Phascolomyces articulosus]|uniref:RGS domain-containing protein n=1 Tax=Phascolomyces articulosus TaxID=60185 RepID=A0AAD5PIT3_9FUNG|nr:hypothetical protein BDA99DRAFT_588872 [Phascolomyces articulosus]